MKYSGWSGRGAFVGSCPNRIRRGVGRGAASPPAGVCPGVQEPSRSQREDGEIALRVKWTPPGALTPGPPHAIAPECAGDGREGVVADEEFWIFGPGAFCGFLPQSHSAGGSGGSQPPGRCLPGRSGTLTFPARRCGKRSDGWSGHRAGGSYPRTPASELSLT